MKRTCLDSTRSSRASEPAFRTERLTTFAWVACLALAAGTLLPVAAAAQGDLCGDCNLERLRQDYQEIYDKATEQYQEVAELYEGAADDYEAALDAGVDLLGLPSLPTNLAEACDAVIDSALGGISTAMTALDGLASTLAGLVGEDEAKDKLATANSTAWLARKTKDCIDACCERVRTAKEHKIVADNPEVDWTVEQPEEKIHECLDRLSPRERDRLVRDAERGLFDRYMDPENIEVIKNSGE